MDGDGNRVSGTLAYGVGCSIGAFIFQAARVMPSKAALVFRDKIVTYQELDELTDGLASLFVQSGAGAESRIGVFAEASIDLVVGIIAILKAGAAFVPLEVSDPPERIMDILQRAGVEQLFVQQHLKNKLSDLSYRLSSLDDLVGVPELPKRMHVKSSFAGQLAYIIFTSGTSGVPKGVEVTLGNLQHHILSFRARSGITADDCSLLFSTIAFDGAIEEMFAPLMVGGTLVISAERPVPLAELGALIERHQLTLLDFSVGYWNAWISFLVEQHRKIPNSVRRVVIGGETVLASHIRQWSKAITNATTRLLVTYGPTETTVIATASYYPEDTLGSAQDLVDGFIGRPLEHTGVYLLDEQLLPVLPGAVGELYIGGPGVARGYLRQPALTALKFLPDPFADQAGARMYRTGDKARQMPEGALQFLGRADRQVKIRGYRVEPEDIEKVLSNLPGVGAAQVVAQHLENGDCVLRAFVTSLDDTQLDPLQLENCLASRLPMFMRPSRVQVMERFPLKLNGKVDTQALLGTAVESRTLGEDLARDRPASDDTHEGLVVEMTALFSRVLERPDVSPDDNFFESGGHSLRVLKLLSQLRISHGVTLSMKHFFASPTARGLACTVQRSGKTAQSPQSPISTAWRAAGQFTPLEK